MTLHSERMKIAVKLAAIFLLGAVTGGLLTLRLGDHAPDAGQAWAHRTLEDYRVELGLTDNQVEALRPDFIQAGRKMQSLRATTVAELRAVVRELKGRMQADLSSEQRERLLRANSGR